MKKIAIAVLAVGLTLGLMTTVTAQTSEQTSNVTVNVDQQAVVDVRPSALNYTGNGDFPEGDNSALEPGEFRSISDQGFEHVDISNIGSVDIESVTADAEMPNSTPFAGSTTAHNTGNLVTLSTATANTDAEYDGSVGVASATVDQNPHYLNRVEYSEDNPPEYIQVEQDEAVGGITSGSYETSVGRFRVGDIEYFYVAYFDSGSGLTSSATNGELRIGKAPHTSTTLGTTDFTNDGTNYINYSVSDGDIVSGDTGTDLEGYYGKVPNQQFLVFDPDEGSNSDAYNGQNVLDDNGAVSTSASFTGEYTREYDLFLAFGSSVTDHIQRTRFNTQVYDATTDGSADGDRAATDTTDAQTYLIDGTGNQALNPGQNVPINIGVQLPQGIDSDKINSGIVRFVVTADET